MDGLNVLYIVSIVSNAVALISVIAEAAIICGWTRRYPEESARAVGSILQFLCEIFQFSKKTTRSLQV
jgi:hypothetical protein